MQTETIDHITLTAAAAYTKWLKAEVQEALDDTSPTIPHDEAMRQVRAAIKRA